MVLIVYWIGLPYYLQYKNPYILAGEICFVLALVTRIYKLTLLLQC